MLCHEEEEKRKRRKGFEVNLLFNIHFNCLLVLAHECRKQTQQSHQSGSWIWEKQWTTGLKTLEAQRCRRFCVMLTRLEDLKMNLAGHVFGSASWQISRLIFQWNLVGSLWSGSAFRSRWNDFLILHFYHSLLKYCTYLNGKKSDIFFSYMQ